MEKNNKLIAEFMGYIYEDDRFFMEDSKGVRVYENLHHELKYDSSWDWLMPVIEKCLVGEAEQSEEISNTTIKNIYEGICNQDISFAYKSVIEFIKNQNN